MGEILRVKHSGNFVVVDKTFLKDSRLSFKAKGILTLLLSYPDNWEACVFDLVNQSTDGEHATRSGLKELEKYGYYKKVPIRDEKARIIKWESTVSEVPMESVENENENTEFQNANTEFQNENKYTKETKGKRTKVTDSKKAAAGNDVGENNVEFIESNIEFNSPSDAIAELDDELDFPHCENLKVGDRNLGNHQHNKYINKINNDCSNNIYCASDDAPCFQNTFDVAWERYPRKRGKAKISKKQKKHLCELGQELLRALERYKAELESESWKQPQNGDTFFTRGYIDYLDKNYSPLPKPNAPSMPPPKNQFNNFTQRTYDYDELERLLLTTTV